MLHSSHKGDDPKLSKVSIMVILIKPWSAKYPAKAVSLYKDWKQQPNEPVMCIAEC